MELILEDYEQINNDAFEGTFYYGDNMVIAQIGTDIVPDYNELEVFAVVLSVQQYDNNDRPTELTITNKEIEKFVEEEMGEWFEDYMQGLAESVWHNELNSLNYTYMENTIKQINTWSSVFFELFVNGEYAGSFDTFKEAQKHSIKMLNSTLLLENKTQIVWHNALNQLSYIWTYLQ